jgi:hypothetical protein
MTEYPFILMALLGAALLGALLARSRGFALMIAAASLLLQAAIVTLALGQPKPWWSERGCMRHAGRGVQVLGAVASEGEGSILVWLHAPACGLPVAYSLPYSATLAEQLGDAQQAASKDGAQGSVMLDLEPTLEDREPKFYAPPQPAPEPKTAPPAAPVMVN